MFANGRHFQNRASGIFYELFLLSYNFGKVFLLKYSLAVSGKRHCRRCFAEFWSKAAAQNIPRTLMKFVLQDIEEAFKLKISDDTFLIEGQTGNRFFLN